MSFAWSRAGRDAQAIGRELQRHIEADASTHGARPIVVLDLPDRAGPRTRLMRPYLWRNGLQSIDPRIQRFYRATTVMRMNPHAPRVAELRDLKRDHPRSLILEVVPVIGDRWPAHEVRRVAE